MRYLYGILTLFLSTISAAAEVPAGVVLAQKQIFNRGIGAEIVTLDPQRADDVQSHTVLRDLFESLVRDNGDGKIVPAGATSWQTSTNGLTWTFKLRENALWSNGEKITAKDYVYGMQRLVDPKVASTYSFLLTDVKNANLIIQGKLPVTDLGVHAVNDYTLQIDLTTPVPYMLEILALQNCAPAYKKGITKHGDAFFNPKNLVSNGAYDLKYWKVGDKITLAKNSKYWNASKVVIQEVNFYPTQNTNSEEQMYLSGQLDFTYDISMDKFKSLKQTLGSQVHNQPYLTSYWLDFNMTREPFKSSSDLRQALAMVIDKNVLVDTITARGERASDDIVPMAINGFTPNTYSWNNLSYPQRVALAKKLYEAAGYSDKHPLTVTILYGTGDNFKKIILAIASMWKKSLGINVKLENQEWKVFLVSRQERNFQISWDRWIGDYNDPNTFLDLLRSDNVLNSPGYNNKRVDAMLQHANTQLDPKKRAQILSMASALAMNEYPIIPLYSGVTTHLIKSNIKGYTGKNPLDHLNTADLYIVAK